LTEYDQLQATNDSSIIPDLNNSSHNAKTFDLDLSASLLKCSLAVLDTRAVFIPYSLTSSLKKRSPDIRVFSSACLMSPVRRFSIIVFMTENYMMKILFFIDSNVKENMFVV
jgi:hypothetical protein